MEKTESDYIQALVQATAGCLQSLLPQGADTALQIGELKVLEESPVLLEYTGLVGVSGQYRGCLYLTGNADFLRSIISEMLGKQLAVGELDLRDMVGELINTVVGNAREFLGPGFLASLPVIIEGAPRGIEFPLRLPAYIVSMVWRGQECYLVVGLEK